MPISQLLRKAALVAAPVLMRIGSRMLQYGHGGPMKPQAATAPPSDTRIQQEIANYQAVENVHDLPAIFHYWSNRYVRPKLEEVLGVSGFPDFYTHYIGRYADAHPGALVEVVSLGAGNAELEVDIAERLQQRGLSALKFHCLDLNPAMLARGREHALRKGLADKFVFTEMNLAEWRPGCPIAVVMAHHSLHHMVELETLFERIKDAIGSSGYFVSSDMIGRNGHMRWPEALAVIHAIWKDMPERYKYNHQLKRLEPEYENWDCSNEGFEGIRAQDILPLLVRTFHFESFVGYGNLPDVFVDRGFGHNFDITNPEDTAFIDRIAILNDEMISSGTIKPTQMAAVMRSAPVAQPRWYRNWSPEFCVRPVDTL
jgi:SAM-dependent methyltransferase